MFTRILRWLGYVLIEELENHHCKGCQCPDQALNQLSMKFAIKELDKSVEKAKLLHWIITTGRSIK